mmetsp:Transcript_2191/g.4601  ORF Transcript_2191/g.4601 Transcript_2191/m.4601 type:complete len:83 (-) Transcript_2191:1178-1426(-)
MENSDGKLIGPWIMPQLSFLIRIRPVLRGRISLIYILDIKFIALSVTFNLFVCCFERPNTLNQIMDRTQNSRCIVTNVLDKN